MKNRVEVEARCWNVQHEKQVEARRRRPVTLTVKVDTSTFMTVIPETLATRLGLLRATKRERFRLANGKAVLRHMALGLRIEVMGRNTLCRAVIEPGRDTVLLGLRELEDLDLDVDTTRKTLVPNPLHPEGWVHEME